MRTEKLKILGKKVSYGCKKSSFIVKIKRNLRRRRKCQKKKTLLWLQKVVLYCYNKKGTLQGEKNVKRKKRCYLTIY